MMDKWIALSPLINICKKCHHLASYCVAFNFRRM